MDDKFINKQVRFFVHQTMCLKRVEQKKLLGRYNKSISLNTFAKWLFNYFFKKLQKQPPELFYKKAFVKELAIFMENIFLNSVYSEGATRGVL